MDRRGLAKLPFYATSWRATAFVQKAIYVDFAQSPRPVSVLEFIEKKSEKELNVSCPEPFSELHRSFVE